VNNPLDRSETMVALKRALPYIRLYKGKTFVVKTGGALCAEPQAMKELAHAVGVLREFGIRVVLVHGGGPQTSTMSRVMGLEPTFVEGRRVTCEKTLDIAVMTMNGTVNTAMLAACRATNLPAVGLSGLDGGLIRARRRPARVKVAGDVRTTIDYGHVGDIVAVDATVLESLLDAGFVPVVSPLSADDEGNVLNINADTVAATIARELCAEKLVFLSDSNGILEDRNDPSSLISYTDVRGLNLLVERGIVDAGMLPKVNAAKEALYGGVKRVHVIGGGSDSLLVEVFTNEGAGTLIVMDARDLTPAEQGHVKDARLDALMNSGEAGA